MPLVFLQVIYQTLVLPEAECRTGSEAIWSILGVQIRHTDVQLHRECAALVE
jgi:hypothetical protein